MCEGLLASCLLGHMLWWAPSLWRRSSPFMPCVSESVSEGVSEGVWGVS